MNHAEFRFHGELNDFLPALMRGNPVPITFGERQTVKHLFESLGIPHTEVAQVLVDNKPVDFSFQARDGDQIDVMPFSPVERGLVFRQNGAGLLLDMHLGKLARYLRLLGFDVMYSNQITDSELAEIAEVEHRILLTRDRRLLMRKQVQFGYCVRDLNPPRQIREVLERFDLLDHLHPFLRCPRCNTLLEPVSKADVLHKLEPLTRRYFEDFQLCPGCKQVYWEGSHIAHMREWIEELSSRTEENP